MGKVKIKQTPRRLNPYGEKLVKIWYDDNEPPKKYIWYKDGEYHYWDGEHWEVFDWDVPESIDSQNDNNGDHNHGHHHCDCDCCEKIKFDKFKKDVLAAVLKLIKAQDKSADSELEERIEELESDVNVLKQINHDLFVKNTELESLLDELGYLKEDDIDDPEVLSGLGERLSGIEEGVSTANEQLGSMQRSVGDNTANIRTLNNRLSAVENAGYITSDALSDYAPKSYVDDAVSNINIPTKLSDLENDNGFISEVNVELINSEEEPIALANGDVINLVETATYNRDGNKIEINRRPYQVSIETEQAEPFDPSVLEERIGSVESGLEETNSNISALEGVVSDNELVISAAFNDLNDRMLVIENEQE